MKKVILFLIALLTLLFFTSCGEKEYTLSSTDENMTSNNYESSEIVSELNSDKVDPDEDSENPYNYLSLISQEFESGENIIGDSLDYYRPGFTKSGKLIFSYDFKVYTYNKTTKKIKDISPRNDEAVFDWYYAEDRVYFIYDDDSYIITDDDGNVLKDNSSDEHKYEIIELYDLENGNYVIKDLNNEPCNVIATYDWEYVTSISYPQKKIDHGLTENMSYEIIGGYKGKIFAVTDSGFVFSYDTDSKTWEQTNTELTYDQTNFKQQVGRYVIYDVLADNCKIYDMENDEIIASINTNDNLPYYYRGGEFVMKLIQDYWYKIPYMSNNITVDIDDCQKLGKEEANGEITRIDDTYYLLEDDYGIFLRTYEKGEDQEETLLRFD